MHKVAYPCVCGKENYNDGKAEEAIALPIVRNVVQVGARREGALQMIFSDGAGGDSRIPRAIGSGEVYDGPTTIISSAKDAPPTSIAEGAGPGLVTGSAPFFRGRTIVHGLAEHDYNLFVDVILDQFGRGNLKSAHVSIDITGKRSIIINNFLVYECIRSGK